MHLGDFTFPLYLIKFCEKEEYIDDIIEGKLYMNASGYFRDLPGENTYRGDPFDGRRFIDVGNEEMYLEQLDGERVYLNGVPGFSVNNFTVGFSGDDKIPIWCACLMSDKVLEKIDETSMKLKKEYAEALSKFGKYAILISFDELVKKLNEFHKNHSDIQMYGKEVEYCDISKEYPIETLNDNGQDWTTPFFKKDNAYKLQNEWRLMALCGGEALVESYKDHWICDVGPFLYAVRMKTEDLVNGTFHICEE